MILQDLRCKTCGEESKDVYIHMADRTFDCPRCLKNSSFEIVFNKRHIEVWQPGYWEDLAPTPVYITSKRQLREECKKRGLISVAYS